jgi:hypothetical protein
MIYHARKGQVSSGEAIGILLLDTSVPFIPGDVANATTYDFPVRFRKVEGFSVASAIGKDPSVYPDLKAAAEKLAGAGGAGGHRRLRFHGLSPAAPRPRIGVPVFLSSLLQIPFMLNILGDGAKVGVLTADGRSLDAGLLAAVGVAGMERLVIEGLENRKNFYRFAIEETGTLDAAAVAAEVVDAGRQVLERDPAVKAFLLECSLLPPYASALQAAVQLPVFDYITMINFVFSAVVKRSYAGFL